MAGGQASVPSEGAAEEDESRGWNFFHKTSHELRLRVTPRVDKDFVAKFSFEKISCTSEFEVGFFRTAHSRVIYTCTSRKLTRVGMGVVLTWFDHREYDIKTIKRQCLQH